MIINLDDVANAKKLNGILEENEKFVNQYRESYERLINEQEKIIVTYISKLAPILNYLVNKGYVFIHPSLKYNSKLGAILDYNGERNLLYIWDIKSHIVKEINMHNQDERLITLNVFIRFCNFENAINGILFCLKLQNELTEEYQKEIDMREQIISKYQDIII